jgi:carbonic anhydrase
MSGNNLVIPMAGKRRVLLLLICTVAILSTSFATGTYRAIMKFFGFNVVEKTTWSKPDFEDIFANNRKWVRTMKQQDPEFFEKLKKGQSPQYLFIGCSDSRVPAQEILGLKAGELFVHRNVANLVVNGDMNLLAVLQYSVEVLKVKDIIVCGHYACGGVKAGCSNQDLGLIEHWLRNIRDVKRIHRVEIEAIKDEDEQHKRMVELNVQEQCLHLYTNPIVQKAQKATGYPRIHGFVYDIAEGLIKDLNIDFKAKVRRMSRLYSL